LASPAPAASDYQWTFNNNDIFSYTLTSVSSNQVYMGTLPAENPTISLVLGKRYGVTVVNFTQHPFQVLAKGATSASDVILLSMGSSLGSLNSDAGINFTDDGSGTVEFTVTQTLVDAMTNTSGLTPGYRCGVHITVMRGDFTLYGTGAEITDPIPAAIPKGTIIIGVRTVVEGLIAPVGLVDPDDGTGRLFVFDQAGSVTTLLDGIPQPTPFLDVSNRLVPLGIVEGINIGYDERGFLGFALHPQFATNGKVYTYTSEPISGPADFTVPIPGGRIFDCQSVVAEWQVSTTDTNQIDPSTRRELLRIDEPQFNHKGGKMIFGPDGYLYLGLGDGGGADDEDGQPYFGQPAVGHGPDGNGQNTDNVLGTILRIDVDGNNSANAQYGIPPDNPFVGGPGVDEIYAYGFRNPFSFSFDRLTGDFYVGDVGQNDIEEVDLVTKGNNYGWRLKEGSFYFDPNGTGDGFVTTVPVQPLPAGLVDPIAEYDHDEGVAIIGGYVYRGTQIPDLEGRYVFGELGSFGAPTGRLLYLDASDQILELRIGMTDQPLGLWVKGFAEDHTGELYVLASGSLIPFGTEGKVLKISVLTAANDWIHYE
jgi:glucose/arabinose dehydrogenase